MAVAGVPLYLGKDFSTASPGLRFGMYLPLWGIDTRSGELLWTTHDVSYRTAGHERQERSFNVENKSSSLRQATVLTRNDIDLMHAFAQRQAALALPGIAEGSLLALDAKAIAPFTTGLGNEHPLENGFAFLNPYGLPYLPASGVKGVIRAAARELAAGEWSDSNGWTLDAITALFGLQSDDGSATRRGTLVFWDVIPQLPGDSLQIEVMTPHQNHYLQGKEPPHDSGQPNPITFLTVPPGATFAFHVACDLPFLSRIDPDSAVGGRWQSLVEAAFAHAFSWLGFGAKTAVGYGSMEPDISARQRRARALTRAAEEARKTVTAAALNAELEAMDPIQRELRLSFDARTDKNQSERAYLFNELKKGAWSGEHKLAAARRVESLMREAKAWQEKSAKKNPEKDFNYQDTLLVKKWLAGG